MAGRGPTVTLTFAGDDSRLKSTLRSIERSTSSLDRPLRNVGIAAAGMGAATASAGLVAGAAIAGLGAGIVGLGVLAAVQSEKVKKAFTGLGDHVKKETQKLAAPYEKALLDIEKKARTTFDRVKPMLGEMFNVSSPYLSTLADGLLGFVENALPGMKQAITEAKPVIDALAEGLKGTGTALSQMFKNISGDGGAKSAADAVKMLFQGINWVIPKVGELINWLMRWSHVLLPVSAALLGLVAVMKIVNTAMAIYRAAMALTAVWTVVKWTWSTAVVVAKWVWMATMATLNAARIAVVWLVQTAVTTAGVIASWVAASAVVVAKWVWMGLQAMVQAVRMAAAWVIAMGPVGWVIALIVGLVAIVIANWDTIVAWTKQAWTTVSTWVGQKVEEIRAWITEKLTAAKDAVVGAWEGAKAATAAAWEALKSTVSEKVNGVVAFVRALPGKILSALGNLGGLLLGSGQALVNGFLNGIRGAWNSVMSFVRNGVAQVRALFPFSPAKDGPFSGRGYVTHSGKALTTDFAKSLRDGLPTVASAAAAVMGAAHGSLNGHVAVSAPRSAVAGGAAGRAGGASVRFVGNTDTAMATAVMHMIRTGKIQVAV